MARGSRYGIERLVGPVTMDQNSYIDIAKANIIIDNIVPTPSLSGGSAEITTGNHTFPTLSQGGVDIGPGDLIRIITTTAATSVQFLNSSNTAVSGTALLHVRANSEILVVIPLGAAGYFLGVAIAVIEFTKAD